jgi:hypothetical protein
LGGDGFSIEGGAGGWPVLEALVASHPASSRNVAAGFGASGPAGQEGPASLDLVAVPDLPASYQRLVLDQLGSWLLETYLTRIQVPGYGSAAAQFLIGDRFSIHHDGESGTTVTTWRLRFDSYVRASELKSALHFIYPDTCVPTNPARTWCWSPATPTAGCPHSRSSRPRRPARALPA